MPVGAISNIDLSSSTSGGWGAVVVLCLGMGFAATAALEMLAHGLLPRRLRHFPLPRRAARILAALTAAGLIAMQAAPGAARRAAESYERSFLNGRIYEAEVLKLYRSRGEAGRRGYVRGYLELRVEGVGVGWRQDGSCGPIADHVAVGARLAIERGDGGWRWPRCPSTWGESFTLIDGLSRAALVCLLLVALLAAAHEIRLRDEDEDAGAAPSF